MRRTGMSVHNIMIAWTPAPALHRSPRQSPSLSSLMATRGARRRAAALPHHGVDLVQDRTRARHRLKQVPAAPRAGLARRQPLDAGPRAVAAGAAVHRARAGGHLFALSRGGVPPRA